MYKLLQRRVEDPPGFARALCDRHYGIGADGLILICPSKVSDLKWRYTIRMDLLPGCAAMASDAWENMYMITDLPERKLSVYETKSGIRNMHSYSGWEACGDYGR